MNKKQINRIEMFRAVHTLLNNYNDVVSQAPILVETKNQFDALLLQIEESEANQKEAQIYLSGDKIALKRLVAEKADILNDALEAYANVNGDVDLFNEASKTFSDLYRLRNEDFISTIPKQIKLLEANLENLSDYLVNEPLLTDLKNSFDNFLAINGKPRQYLIRSIEATSTLEELLAETQQLLDTRMDKIVTVFKNKDPKFFKSYHASRRIVDA
ncbi:hypothetical protein [Galbibacter mesophilus]|uniref:hypothetical protein n=1 Tax=Galbibacter mesophilus TaxID=379069 RepID=UPI00191E972F|nr:hypothetical protein [Galbibacter mesophilus]MCM5664120.1 hypothetical protein [Galbibacter mesophilus]